MRDRTRTRTRTLTLAALLAAFAPLTASAQAAGSRPPTRFGDVRLATGVRLHYAEQGDPAGRPVILLHGYSDSWFSYSRVLPLLPAELHAYALDQRGHGRSDRPAGGYAIADLTSDVLAFLDAKRIDRATVVGHSMGSLVAQQLAIRAPERVERLVLIGSGATVANVPGIDELGRAVAGLTDPADEEFVRGFQLSTITVPVPDEFLERVVAESRLLPARAWKALFAAMRPYDSRAELGRIQAETLIVWGEQDAIFPRSEQEVLAAGIPGARLVAYRETGHAPHWERPGAFARDLLGFVGGRDGGTAGGRNGRSGGTAGR